MILELDENFRVLSDEYNFILQKRTDPKKGAEYTQGEKVEQDGWMEGRWVLARSG